VYVPIVKPKVRETKFRLPILYLFQSTEGNFNSLFSIPSFEAKAKDFGRCEDRT
jgi:hypothetical protein